MYQSYITGRNRLVEYMKNEEGRFQPVGSVPYALYAYQSSKVSDDNVTESSITITKVQPMMTLSIVFIPTIPHKTYTLIYQISAEPLF